MWSGDGEGGGAVMVIVAEVVEVVIKVVVDGMEGWSSDGGSSGEMVVIEWLRWSDGGGMVMVAVVVRW
ncbi:hypothetical protein JCGZ_03629 [Jatropha curcas]|uniref:Uncharacterized protein n=1 Tax=Jatropha curcas TaxID=180498 RepID=A0A067L1P7_JATCU|nr:hypothetical protein JCGZ_03629 [Jatropha curcas]